VFHLYGSAGAALADHAAAVLLKRGPAPEKGAPQGLLPLEPPTEADRNENPQLGI
jgi:hypothetical protein